MSATSAARNQLVSVEERPHMVAMLASIVVGYRFHYLGHDGSPLSGADVATAFTTGADRIALIYAFRPRGTVVDTYRTYDRHTAMGERYRASEFHQEGARPLWSAQGSVADVVAHLLSLPDDDQRGAPRRTCAGNELWLPGQPL